jgi:hypothetical protein
MSMPIKKAFAATVGLNITWRGDVEHWEAQKDEVIEGFGVSYRQWQIDFSEKFMKPLYGDDIFVKLFISRMQRQQRDAIILVPDCGFDIEYQTLVREYGAENILVIKIYRPNTSFAGDSRGYLSVGGKFVSGLPDETGKYVAHTNNAGSKEEFETKILNLVKEWLK